MLEFIKQIIFKNTMLFKNPFLFHLQFYSVYIEDIKEYNLKQLFNIFNKFGSIINIEIINKKTALIIFNKLNETEDTINFKNQVELTMHNKYGYNYYINNERNYLTLYKNYNLIKYKYSNFTNCKKEHNSKKYSNFINNYGKFITMKRSNISPSPEINIENRSISL